MPAFRVQVEFVGLGGSPYLATHYIDQGLAVDEVVAVSAVGNFWGAVDGVMANDLTWTTLPEVPLFSTPDTITSIQSVPTVGGAGAVSNPPLARSTQGLVRWLTNSFAGNRRVQGKTYVPGLTTSALNDTGGLVAPVRSTLQTAAEGLADDGLVVASRVANTFNAAVGASVWGEFAVLRSRRD